MAYIILTQKVPPTHYRDEIGITYNYPKRYWNRVHTGDRFIYHQPRTKGGGMAYIGCGVIGLVSLDPQDTNRQNAELLDYTPFELPVSIRNEVDFLEPDIVRPADFRGNAVRQIPDEIASLILRRAKTEPPWFSNITLHLLEGAESLGDPRGRLQKHLSDLDGHYSKMKPESRRRSLRQLNRPSSIGKLIKELRGTTCSICSTPGFSKPDGSTYAEVHHVEELNTGNPGVLGSDNIIVVCANCHRKLHYADVDIVQNEGGWTIVINGESHFVRQFRSSA